LVQFVPREAILRVPRLVIVARGSTKDGVVIDF